MKRVFLGIVICLAWLTFQAEAKTIQYPQPEYEIDFPDEWVMKSSREAMSPDKVLQFRMFVYPAQFPVTAIKEFTTYLTKFGTVVQDTVQPPDAQINDIPYSTLKGKITLTSGRVVLMTAIIIETEFIDTLILNFLYYPESEKESISTIKTILQSLKKVE